MNQGWSKDLELEVVERDKVYDLGEIEPWLLLAMFGHISITLY